MKNLSYILLLATLPSCCSQHSSFHALILERLNRNRQLLPIRQRLKRNSRLLPIRQRLNRKHWLL